MKPIRLSMTAFGAYAGTQVVDFTELGDRSFFLIHGPTGAGKTTLLDALSYALYGETSGNERGADQMRSHHTRTNLLTQVTFDFALGAERYRIKRQPKQERPKLRGEGTVVENADATLWRRTASSSEDDEGQVLAAGQRTTDEAVRNLFGFDSRQFRQVIMLPQDQFRQLLKATSKEREELFQTLFQTEYYEKVEAALKEAAKALADEIKGLQDQQNTILQQAGVASASELDTQAVELEEEQEALAVKFQTLQAAEQSAQQERLLAEGIDLCFVELEAAQKTLDAILIDEKRLKQARLAWEAGRRALVLIEVEAALLRQQDAYQRVKAERDSAQIKYEAASHTHKTALAALELEENRKPDIDIARTRRDELRGMFKRVQELEVARERLSRAQTGARAAQRTADTALKELKAITVALARLEEDITNAGEVTAELAGLRASEKELNQATDARKKLDDTLKQLHQGIESQGELAGKVTAYGETLQAARDEDHRLNAAWRAAQAGVLAKRLASGQPCPVCGATHHPHPAESSAEVPSEETLQAGLGRIRQAEKAHSEAQAAVATQVAALSAIKARIEMLEPQLGAYSERTHAQLKKETAKTKRNREQAEEREKQLAAWKRQRDEQRREQPVLEKLCEEVDGAMRAAQAELTIAETQFGGRSEGLPADLQTTEAVTDAEKLAAEHVASLEAAYAAAVKKAQEAETGVAASHALVTQLTQQASDAQIESARQAEAFLERLQENGFDSEATYRSARRSKEDIDGLEREISDYDAKLRSARDRRTRAEDGIAGLIRPDLPAVRKTESDARQRVVDAATEAGRIANELKQKARWAADLRARAKDLKSCDDRYRILGRVSGVANGVNEFKLNFQRFVLGALLDDVLVQATKRLQAMSNGRYLLQRRLEPANRRRASGLDLDVTDTWTGETTRPVETLSGGEGFMAALALALGLADTVQAYTGGIRLDTIFIDEGFGSLDANALDRAISTLLTLNASGRLVGIISHVESLTERVSTRLEVTAGQQGSSARFIVN